MTLYKIFPLTRRCQKLFQYVVAQMIRKDMLLVPGGRYFIFVCIIPEIGILQPKILLYEFGVN